MPTTTQTKRPLVLVTGANGQLGKELRQLETKWPEFEFLFLSREDLPIHHFELVRNFFKATHPTFLINCAAYTAVDKAEREEELAFQTNAEAVGVLAAICKEQDCKFVHVSTDYVFDGLANRPYREDDLTNPQGVYGASKLAGEKEAVLLNPDSVIIRTSWVYSSFGKNFVKTILRLLQEKPSVSVVDDQIGSPTYAADLAVAILEIISLKSWKPGVYHFSNEGEISWCAFAKAIAALTHSNTPVQAITTAEFPTPAKRPAWSVLDKSKIKAVYGIKIRPWKESLADCLELLSK
jgi:dTDP-4-dehydrorhamnose reductase